jgi:hypothetical protein
MRDQYGIAIVVAAGVMLVSLLGLAIFGWRRWAQSRAVMSGYDRRLAELLKHDKALRANIRLALSNFEHGLVELQRLARELEERTGAILVPGWLNGETNFVSACKEWELRVAEAGGQVPSKDLVAEYEARVKTLICDALSSRLHDGARQGLAAKTANLAELMLKNTDLYLDKEKRNYGLQEALRGVVASGHMVLIAPRPNERYTEMSGVTRTVRSVTCRGLKYGDNAALPAGSVICDPMIEESTY